MNFSGVCVTVHIVLAPRLPLAVRLLWSLLHCLCPGTDVGCD